MRKLTSILLLLIASSLNIDAQSRIQELGLSYSGFNILGVRYKLGNENSLFRLTILNIGGGNGKSKYEDSESKSSFQGIGLNVGLQKFKSISDDVFFYYGADLLSSFESSSAENVTTAQKSTSKTFSNGLGFILGFAYYFSSSVNLSAEIVPSVWYSTSKSTSTIGAMENSHNSNRIGYGFNSDNNSYANLTLSFRINPKKER